MTAAAISKSIYFVTVLILLIVTVKKDVKRRFYVPAKLAASTFFIIYAFFTHIAPILYFPLAACWLGDLFMGVYNIRRKKRFIALGILFFMLSHIGFLVWLYSDDLRVTPYDVIIPIFGALSAFLIIYLFHMHLGRLRPAAIVYACFVSAFAIKAVESGVALGGTLFFISDLLILFLYFYHFKSKALHILTHIVNLATYYLAILFIIEA